MAENPYGLPEPARPQPAVPENPYGLPEPRGGQGLRHWPGCNGNHPLGTGCRSKEMDRRRAEALEEIAALAADDPDEAIERLHLVRRAAQGTARYTAQETIPAGATCEVDTATGMLRLVRNP